MHVDAIAEQIPADVLRICRRLADHDQRGYVVGGSIRDLLMGRIPGDWDIATTATPDVVQRIFPRTVPTGIAHGTITVLAGKNSYEVTTLRGEGAYSDGRRPDSVEFLTDIEKDLARRDFTVNAIAFDPIGLQLHDPFGGRKDLERGVLRTVGDAVTRFEEDGLRVLRGTRFAATLEFSLEAQSLAGMKSCASMLPKVSAERKRDELQKLLLARSPSLGLALIERTQILPHLFSVPIEGFSTEMLARIDALEPNLPLRLAALLAHADLRSAAVEPSLQSGSAWLLKMKFDKKTSNRVQDLLRHGTFIYRNEMSDSELRGWVRRTGFSVMYSLIDLWRADARSVLDTTYSREVEDLLVRVAAQQKAGAPVSVKELAVGGRELMSELELQAGPWLGDLLEHLLDRVVDTPSLNTHDGLIGAAREWQEKRS